MENNKRVKLVGFWVSPFVQRVKWALKFKGIDYEYIEDDIYNKSPLIFELNPVYVKVPVLVHDQKPVKESCFILEYIDEVWRNNPLLPEYPYERAEMRFWAKVSEEKLLDNAWLALCSQGEKQNSSVKSAIEAMEKIENKLKGNKFFGGNTIGYLDLMFGFVSYMLPVWEELASVKILDPLRFPVVAAWSKNFLDHPLIKGEHLPSKNEMMSYFKRRQEELTPVYASGN